MSDTYPRWNYLSYPEQDTESSPSRPEGPWYPYANFLSPLPVVRYQYQNYLGTALPREWTGNWNWMESHLAPGAFQERNAYQLEEPLTHWDAGGLVGGGGPFRYATPSYGWPYRAPASEISAIPLSTQYGSDEQEGPSLGPVPDPATVQAGAGADATSRTAFTEYSQSTGQLSHVDNETGERTALGAGYAGKGTGLNNPAMQSVTDSGPLPQGYYYVGPLQTNTVQGGRMLPDSMRLAPFPSNHMFGRKGFLIHGGNFGSRDSSKGCIVAPPYVRRRIGAIREGGDKILKVVP